MSALQAEAQLDALRRDSEFTDYVKRLESAGYFKGEREGSAQWKSLELKAMNIFVKSRSDEYVA